MNRINRLISNLKLRSKLRVLVGLFLLSLIFLGFANKSLFKTSQTVTILVNEERIFSENLEASIEHFYRYEISDDTNELVLAREHLQKSIAIAYEFSKMDVTVNEMEEEIWMPYLFEVFKEGVNYDRDKIKLIVDQINLFAIINPTILKDIQQITYDASVLGQQVYENFENYPSNKTPEKLSELQEQFDGIHNYSTLFLKELYGLSDDLIKLLNIINILIILFVGVIVLLIAFWLSNSITKPINILTNDFKRMSKGDLKSSIKIDSADEIGILSKTFYEIQGGLNSVISHAKKIAKGDYTTRLEPYSDKDELSLSLNTMAEKLEEVSKNTDRENWLQKRLNGLDDQMRGNLDVKELSERIANYLCQSLGAEMGAVYVYDEVLGSLELSASVGLNINETPKTVKPGDGLIGSAAKNNEFLIVDAKDKIAKIHSATAEILPEKLYIMPLHFDGNIQSVIELVAVNSFSEIKLDFLKLIKERISINLNAAIARQRNKELLDKSLEQAEVLKARDKELSLKLEEIQEISENLKYQTTLLDSMMNTLPDNVYFKDKESRFLRVSESMAKDFKVKSSQDIIGKTDFDFHLPENAKKFYNEEQEIIKNEKGFIDDVLHSIDENGDDLWKSVTKLPLFDEKGNCIGTFGITKNITDIKQLEKEVKIQNDNLVANQEELIKTIDEMEKIQLELKHEKQLMDSLLDNLPDAVYFKDKESKFMKVSKSMARLFNFEKQEDLYGKTDFDMFGKDHEHAIKAFEDEQKIIKSKVPIIGKIETETFKDGSVRYVSSTKMPLINENGEAIGTFGISRDITKIKELEFEVKERNEELKTQKKELELFNEKLKQQQEELQATNEELHAQEEELRVANEEMAEQTKVLIESQKNLQVQQEELRVVNEELEVKTEMLEKQKKEILENTKKLEIASAELEKKAKDLELASQYKSEFLANMSHELRTPLNSMLILSKLLRDNKSKNLTEDQVKSITIIHNSGKDLLELINEILDLSKIEAGKMNFNFEKVQINDITEEIKVNFTPVAEDKKLELKVERSDDFPDTIYTDHQRLMQIIKNLLSNAFKFTTKGGIKVKFGVPKENVNFTNTNLNINNTCFISVEDSGVGIPQSKVDAIFEAFQQADGSISRKFGGTGLGLSISKQITQVFGGEIHVSSEEGVGSVFTVYLPLEEHLIGKEEIKVAESHNKSYKIESDQKDEIQEPVEKIAEPVEKKLPVFVDDDRNLSNNKTIVLIVDDDKKKVKTLIDLCHKKNFKAIAASNIPDGIALAEVYPPKAIIISAELNNAKELAKLKENKLTVQVPLHVVSRIDDFTIDDIEDLQTLESKDLQTETENIETKIGKEFNQILVVEDDPATQIAIQKLFENKNLIIHEATTANQAYNKITKNAIDCMILDLGLPDYSGTELLEKLKQDNIPIPYVIINTARELSSQEVRKLQQYSDSIVIKGVKSDERLLDEVTLFLHQVSNSINEKEEQNVTDEEENIGFKGKKVLVVDDDIRNVFAMAQILEERDIEILEAENGEIALEVLKNNKDIDLVLMDVMMPVMNGYEAMEIIRKTDEISNIPIIILTAKAMKEDYQKAIDLGANDFISKPVDIDKLVSLLKIWLSK